MMIRGAVVLLTGRLLVISVLLMAGGAQGSSREKRFLLFPRSAPTRMQLISGIGIPVDLEMESLTVGYVFKAEYFLPWNVSSLYNWLDEPFKPYPIPANGRRRRQVDNEKSERYDVEALEVPDTISTDSRPNVIEQEAREERAWYERMDDDDDDEDVGANDGDDANSVDGHGDVEDDGGPYTLDDVRVQRPQNLAHSRFTLYKGLEKLAATSGLPGRPCLLRSICETAEAPFTYSHGVLGELAHLIMTPSSSVDELSDHSDNEYLRAEQLGVAGEPCDQIFKECPTSFLNKFSGIYETLNMFE